MATRTTAKKVKEIIKTNLTEDQVEPYVISANVFVSNIFGTGTSDLLAEIERWVSAHMIASTKTRQATNEKAGTASVTYSGQYGQGLASTSYGQMAMALDSTGVLASLGGKAIQLFAVPSFSS